jgi:hypothetical protein
MALTYLLRLGGDNYSMSEDPQILADSLRTEVVQIAAVHEEAQAKAREADMHAVVTSAFKEVLSEQGNQYVNIMTTLATLVAGQSATNQHLTILNGKVAKHEESLNILLIWKAEAKGFLGAINIGWTLIISLISGAGISLFYWLTHRFS